jgi:hypothetical protein
LANQSIFFEQKYSSRNRKIPFQEQQKKYLSTWRKKKNFPKQNKKRRKKYRDKKYISKDKKKSRRKNNFPRTKQIINPFQYF